MEKSKSPQHFIRMLDNRSGSIAYSGLKRVFYPSTIAIDEKPPDMGEYVSSKLAGEMLCQYFEKNYGMIKIYRPRLPRMETDQTVSLFSVVNSNPIPIQLEHLRIFRNQYEI